MRAGRTPVGPIVALLFLGLLAAAAEDEPSRSRSRYRLSDAPVPEWREGPIRYIITRSEDNEYRDLDAEEDRRRFIETFWRKRDPTPETPGNEFRSQFWKRVRDANSNYGKMSPRPGWLTDMGKIHILLGPPDDISRDEMAQGRRGIIVWTYRNSPSVGGQGPQTGPNQVIAFAQDASGEYRMSSEPSRLADVWEGLPNPQPPMGQYAFFEARAKAYQEAYARYVGLSDPIIRAAGGPGLQRPLEAEMILARLQQPPKEWSLTTEVTTREFFGSLPFRARCDFFKASGPQAHVILTVAVKSRSVTYRATPSGEQPDVRVYARVLDSTATELALSLEGEGDFAPAVENLLAGIEDDLLFQARAALAPGSYVVRLSIFDDVGGRSGTSDTPFSVPDFGAGRLELSTVALAKTLEQVAAPAGASGTPFVIGTLRILPHVGQDFAPGEDLAFYYQIYGADRDPATGQPKLNVSYVFFAQGEDRLEEIGRTSFTGQAVESHGYALPLKGFPPGGYMVRVEVEDVVASRKVTRDILFRVLEAP